MSELDNLNAGAAERPAFLKVMCIIAWVLHGLGAIFSGIAWAGAGMMSSMSNTVADNYKEPDAETQKALEDLGLGDLGSDFGDQMANSLEHLGTTSMVGFLGAIICIFGAVMMWKLKKTGFYLYVVGILVPLITVTLLVSFPVGGALFGIAMIVLFGLNLKHLR